MTDRLRHLTDRTVRFTYRKTFGAEIGQAGLGFLRNFSLSATGGVIAGLFMLVTTILAGRILGPQEYGKYALALSYAQFFIIPMALGLDTASVRYIAAEGPGSERKIIPTVFLFVMGTIVIVAAFLLTTLGFWSSVLKTDRLILLFGLVYAVPLALENVFDAFVRGLHRFVPQLWARISEAAVALGLFLIMAVALHHTTFQTYSWAMSAGATVFFLILLRTTARYITGFDRQTLRRILSYGLLSMVGGLSGFLLFNMTRIIIDRYMGPHDLGIYVAYYTASLTVVSQFLIFFNNVFFPTVSRLTSKREVIAMINRVNLLAFFPLLVFELLSTYIILRLYGSAYAFNFKLALLFSITAVFHLYYTIDKWIANAEGVRGAKKTIVVTTVVGLLQVALAIALIRPFGLSGAITSTLAVNLILLYAFKRSNRGLYGRPRAEAPSGGPLG